MTKKTCPQCGTKQEEFAKFCRNCGASLPVEHKNDKGTIICSHCGAELNDEAFCPDCGNPTGIKVCPKCRQKSINEDYCSVCGYRINQNVKVCANCGSKIDAKAKVCSNCGANVANKNPIVALVLSMVFPGLGQLYNGQNHKAVTLIIAYVISLALCLLLVGIILVILIWIYGMYDAFTSAKALNEGKSVEDRIF